MNKLYPGPRHWFDKTLTPTRLRTMIATFQSQRDAITIHLHGVSQIVDSGDCNCRPQAWAPPYTAIRKLSDTKQIVYSHIDTMCGCRSTSSSSNSGNINGSAHYPVRRLKCMCVARTTCVRMPNRAGGRKLRSQPLAASRSPPPHKHEHIFINLSLAGPPKLVCDAPAMLAQSWRKAFAQPSAENTREQMFEGWRLRFRYFRCLCICACHLCSMCKCLWLAGVSAVITHTKF